MRNALKIAHAVQVTPGRCGLYETTRELCVGLRELGYDARLVDPKPTNLYPTGKDCDRGAPLDLNWWKSADLVLNHSGMDGSAFEKIAKPIIHVAHGRPRSSYLMQKAGVPVLSYMRRMADDPRVRACVTFWSEHVPFLDVMFRPKQVYAIPAPVDLDFWNYGDYSDVRNSDPFVVCSDGWRDDIDPLDCILVFDYIKRQWGGAKLHLYGTNGMSDAAKIVADRVGGVVCHGWVSREELRVAYTAADAGITCAQIATRSVREAAACGLKMVVVDSGDIGGTAVRLAEEIAAQSLPDLKLSTPKQSAGELQSVIRDSCCGH